MNIEDLDSNELIDFNSTTGEIRFANQRVILIDVNAIGLLRADLIENLGSKLARRIITRFGYSQGWRLAETLESQFHWDNAGDWQSAGERTLMVQGMYGIDIVNKQLLSKDGLTILDSFEAEQHIAHLGRSNCPTCWTICGLMGGYLSRASGMDIFVFEDTCVGCGDAACHLVGRTRAAWEDDHTSELRYFQGEDLSDTLEATNHALTETLKKVERKLHDTRRAHARVTPDLAEPLGLIARSPAMRRLIDLARLVAKVDSTLLITGESGTGKERLARFVHEESSRAGGPFVAVNCAAITETLLESELFGHARGAFTGAVQDRPGLFEAANGGTLLLDEVGEMTPSLQVKLLRALQEREIRRVGENKSRPVDARVLAATNRDLGERIAAGLFRADLFYRLNVVELSIPPLRERREDILPLARVLLAEAVIRLKRPSAGLSPRVADQLLRYDWPGNVRELENAMERTVALASVARMEIEDLPEVVRVAVSAPSLVGPVRSLDMIEKDYILAVLDRNEGNQTQTALQLGIGTATLYRKLKLYGQIRARQVELAKDVSEPEKSSF